MAEKPKAVTALKAGDSLDFHYQKSPEYRAIHCDGAHGGVTPRGYLQFTLYNERNVIPRRTSRKITDAKEGAFKLGDESIEDTLGGIMRQLEITVFMDANTVREFYTWLGGRLWLLEARMGIPEGDRVGTKPDE